MIKIYWDKKTWLLTALWDPGLDSEQKKSTNGKTCELWIKPTFYLIVLYEKHFLLFGLENHTIFM